MRVADKGYVVALEDNIVRVDFSRNPDPPAPVFPGAGGMREMTQDPPDELTDAGAAWRIA